MPKRFTADARRSVLEWAIEEAGRRGDRRVGSDHLLVGLLRLPGGLPAQVLGVDADAARAALQRLDVEALAALGIQAPAPGPAPRPGRRRPPFTTGAREVLRDGVRAATAQRVRAVDARHLVLGILNRRRPDPAAELLVALGVDVAAARERLDELG